MIPAGRPTISRNSNTIYLDIVSDPTGKGSGPRPCSLLEMPPEIEGSQVTLSVCVTWYRLEGAINTLPGARLSAGTAQELGKHLHLPVFYIIKDI